MYYTDTERKLPGNGAKLGCGFTSFPAVRRCISIAGIDILAAVEAGRSQVQTAMPAACKHCAVVALVVCAILLSSQEADAQQ